MNELAPNEFFPRLRPAAEPRHRRAVCRNNRIVRPRDAMEVIMFGRPTTDRPGRGYRKVNAR